MEQYANLSGQSNIEAFLCGPNFIVLKFKAKGKNHYLYDSARPGHHHVERMQELARAGEGLQSYINQHVGDNFARHTMSLGELGIEA